MVLHGYGQLARQLAASTVWPVAPGRAFVFPEALHRFYNPEFVGQPHAAAPVGASWMTREARQDDIADNIAYLDTLRAEFDSNPRLTLLGFSQGSATAARWCEAQSRRGAPPERLVIWGGLMPPDSDLGDESPLRKVRVHFVIGSRDRWITQKRIDAERARLDQARFPYEITMFDGGHRLDDEALAAISSFRETDSSSAGLSSSDGDSRG
jgi:predicted esterase